MRKNIDWVLPYVPQQDWTLNLVCALKELNHNLLVYRIMLQPTEPFVCSNYKNTDTFILTVCWVSDGTKLKGMFCHNKDFNKLKLYLFAKTGVDLGREFSTLIVSWNY